MALALLNTSLRSCYSAGTPVRSGAEAGTREAGDSAGGLRQDRWQVSPHSRMEQVIQSMLGLCLQSQGYPRMTGWLGVERSRNWMVSMWPPGNRMHTGLVREVILPSTCPSRALAEMGDGSFSGRNPSRRARPWSIMLSSAPESIRTVIEWEPEGSRNSPVRQGLLGEAGSVMEYASVYW